MPHLHLTPLNRSRGPGPVCSLGPLLGLLLGCALPAMALDERPPSRDIPFVEKKLDQLTQVAPSAEAQLALSIKPNQWFHAETDNFILHYRRVTEAKRLVLEIEYHLWYVAKALKASKERYQRKSHVFIFEDEKDWKTFLAQSDAPQWAHSFAHGDELYLNVRYNAQKRFDSQTLAHEETHAVVARLYPNASWPIWLNEGFAEYMAGVSVSASQGMYLGHFQSGLQRGNLPVEQLTVLTSYPNSQEAVGTLYQSSEKLIRFLMNRFPKDQFPLFVDKITAGSNFQTAFKEVYGQGTKDFAFYKYQYEHFVK